MRLKLKDFCNIKTGHSFRGQVQAEENGDMYLLQPKDINIFGEIDYDKCIKTSAENIKHIHHLCQGDIVLTNKGSFKSAVFESEKPFITSNAVFVLQADKKLCNSSYLAIWLSSLQCKKQLEKVSLLSATTPVLPRNALNEIEIYLPSIKEQEEIAKAYRLNSKQLILQQEIYNLRKIQLENLMNGER